jgi:hypothetical protein
MTANNTTMFFALLGWLAAFNILADFIRGIVMGVLGW